MRGVFRINSSQKEAFPFLNFIDDVSNILYFGGYNKKIENVAIYSFEDFTPSYIYFLPKKPKGDTLTPVKKIGYFNYNLAQVSMFNEKINRNLYLKDFTYNTNLNLKNENLTKMCSSDRKFLYLHNIVNRMCLEKLSKGSD
jgi:hypothetical protein